MPAVVFDYATWSARFPQLATYTSEPTAALYFVEATMYCDNTDSSPIPYEQRPIFLNLLVAHIAALADPNRGNLVGRIASATQGSVSVSVESPLAPGAAGWYAQTPYGAQYWQLTKPYRFFNYSPGPQRFNQ